MLPVSSSLWHACQPSSSSLSSGSWSLKAVQKEGFLPAKVHLANIVIIQHFSPSSQGMGGRTWILGEVQGHRTTEVQAIQTAVSLQSPIKTLENPGKGNWDAQEVSHKTESRVSISFPKTLESQCLLQISLKWGMEFPSDLW